MSNRLLKGIAGASTVGFVGGCTLGYLLPEPVSIFAALGFGIVNGQLWALWVVAGE